MITAARAIATIHISPRNLELTDDQLTNSSGCIGSLSIPAGPNAAAQVGEGFLRACFLSPYPLPRGATQTNRARPPLTSTGNGWDDEQAAQARLKAGSSATCRRSRPPACVSPTPGRRADPRPIQ